MWALDVLGEEGITFDSSVFPVRHDLYGIPDAERFPSWYVCGNGHRIFEFPPSTIRWRNQNIGVCGGGYLRFLPYAVTHWAIRHINQVEAKPAMIYFHPWEIDPEQPHIRAGRRSILRHYTDLSAMEEKIERLLQDFRFSALSDVSTQNEAYFVEPPAASVETRRSARVAASAAGGV
jgi:polysaccharide deacetylase family protein (PEP-CTERM system associated)